LLERKVLKGRREVPELLDRLVLQEIEETRGHLVLMGSPELLVLRVMWVTLAPPV